MTDGTTKPQSLTTEEIRALFPTAIVTRTDATAYRNDKTGESVIIHRYDPDLRALWCEQCGEITTHERRGKRLVCKNHLEVNKHAKHNRTIRQLKAKKG